MENGFDNKTSDKDTHVYGGVVRSAFDWKKERDMFNQMADYYDRYRPGYPNDIIKTIIERAGLIAGSKLLEIGAGSGKATEQFAEYEFEILCVEPGEDLVTKGNLKFKDKKIKFIASRFEDFSASPGYYDAIISAQAFHWLAQPEGYEKCARALKNGGYLAPFWNIDITHDNDFDNELTSIVHKYGAVSCMPESDYIKRMESISSGIAGSGLFMTPEIIHSKWEKIYTVDDYFGYMLTGNVFIQKSDTEKQMCFDELKRLADKYNGIIKREYTCELYLTRRK